MNVLEQGICPFVAVCAAPQQCWKLVLFGAVRDLIGGCHLAACQLAQKELAQLHKPDLQCFGSELLKTSGSGRIQLGALQVQLLHAS